MHAKKPTISWSDFEKIDLRAGKVVRVEDFYEAKKPAYKVWVDFGPDIGIKQSSAQITTLYAKDELVGKTVIGVVNFAPKQIGPFVSEVLITGTYTEGNVVLLTSDKPAKPGDRISYSKTDKFHDE